MNAPERCANRLGRWHGNLNGGAMRHKSIPAEERYTVFRHDPSNPFVCFYCGEPASTLDHCPPKSRVYDYEALGLVHEAYVKVACCEECNNLLGADLHLDLIERERECKLRLEKRYRRVLEQQDWPEQEIQHREITGRLRQYLENAEKRRQWVERRLEYSLGISALLDAAEAPGGPVRLVAAR